MFEPEEKMEELEEVLISEETILEEIEKDLAQEEISEMKYSSNYYVVQANELIRSKKDDLTLLEAKIIRLAIAQILKDDTDLKTYTCKVSDLALFLGMSKDNIYKEIANFSVNIMRKVIMIEEPNPPESRRKTPNWKIFHWIETSSYSNGILTFKLSEDLKPYLIGLNELFTQYPYAEILSLPTSNSISLFELIATYRNLRIRKNTKDKTRMYDGVILKSNQFIFSIDFLRRYFNCEKKYSLTADFVRRIIDSSVKAINENSNPLFKIKYKTIRERNRIEAILFEVYNIWDKILDDGDNSE